MCIKVTHYTQYYAYNYCNYATVHVQFYYYYEYISWHRSFEREKFCSYSVDCLKLQCVEIFMFAVPCFTLANFSSVIKLAQFYKTTRKL